MKKVKLREVAHARSGDKGNAVNVAVIAYREEDYDLLETQVTVGVVGAAYDGVPQGEIRRYEVPSIGALNFDFQGVLGGGRSRTLAFEESGKALSARILDVEIEVPDDFVVRSEVMGRATESSSPVSVKGRGEEQA